MIAPKTALAQGCGIDVVATPPVVNFPAGALPSNGGPTFYEILDVNYSVAYENKTLAVQYLNGTQWVQLGTLTGNEANFNEVDYGLSSGRAMMGTDAVRVVSGACASNTAAFEVREDPGAAASDLAVYAVLVLLAAIFVLAGRRLKWGRFAVLGAAVYLALAPFTGQRYDIYFLLSSGIRILQHVSPFDPGTPAVYPGPLKWAYPPLYAAYSALSFLLYQSVTGAPLPSVSSLTYPGWLTSTYSVFQAFVPPTLPVLVFTLKLPMVGAAVATGALIAKTTGSGSSGAWWVANPLVVLVAAVWGQLDPIATLFAVASVYAFGKGRPGWAYLFASFGAAVKVWPALIIPILFAVSVRKDGRRALRPLLAVLPAVLVTAALYAAYGNPLQSLLLLAYARGVPTFAGAFSVNGLTWQEILFVMRSPPVPVFLFLGIPVYCAMLGWIYWNRETDAAKWVVASILVFFLTYNYVNPQYFYWIVPFLMIQRRRLSALTFSALPLAFVAAAYNVFYFVSPSVLPDEFVFGASILEQMKVTLFYQTTALFVLVAGILPTAAYLCLLYSELMKKEGADSPRRREGVQPRLPMMSLRGTRPRQGIAPPPENEEGLVAEAIQGEPSGKCDFQPLDRGGQHPQSQETVVQIGGRNQRGERDDLLGFEVGTEAAEEGPRRVVGRRDLSAADRHHNGLPLPRVHPVKLQDHHVGEDLRQTESVPNRADEDPSGGQETGQLLNERREPGLTVQRPVERVGDPERAAIKRPPDIPHLGRAQPDRKNPALEALCLHLGTEEVHHLLRHVGGNHPVDPVRYLDGLRSCPAADL